MTDTPPQDIDESTEAETVRAAVAEALRQPANLTYVNLSPVDGHAVSVEAVARAVWPPAARRPDLTPYPADGDPLAALTPGAEYVDPQTFADDVLGEVNAVLAGHGLALEFHSDFTGRLAPLFVVGVVNVAPTG